MARCTDRHGQRVSTKVCKAGRPRLRNEAGKITCQSGVKQLTNAGSGNDRVQHPRWFLAVPKRQFRIPASSYYEPYVAGTHAIRPRIGDLNISELVVPNTCFDCLPESRPAGRRAAGKAEAADGCQAN